MCQVFLEAAEHTTAHNHLLLTADKTKLLPFPLSPATRFTPVEIGGHLSYSSAKLLGLHLDSRLIWRPHIEYLIAKSTNLYHRIRRWSRCKHTLSAAIIRQLYLTVVQPKISYGITLWVAALTRKCYADMLSSLQGKWAKAICRTQRFSSDTACSLFANLPPLDLFLRQLAAFRVLYNPSLRVTSYTYICDSPLSSSIHHSSPRRLPSESQCLSLPSLPATFTFLSTPDEAITLINRLSSDNASIFFTDGSYFPTLSRCGGAWALFMHDQLIHQQLLAFRGDLGIYDAELFSVYKRPSMDSVPRLTPSSSSRALF